MIVHPIVLAFYHWTDHIMDKIVSPQFPPGTKDCILWEGGKEQNFKKRGDF